MSSKGFSEGEMGGEIGPHKDFLRCVRLRGLGINGFPVMLKFLVLTKAKDVRKM